MPGVDPLGLRFPFVGKSLAVEEAEANLADVPPEQWAALAGAEDPPSVSAEAGVAALLALLGDPRALFPAEEEDADGAGVQHQPWAAAREAAASPIDLRRELQACGPYGASARHLEVAASWLHCESREGNSCHLFKLQRELEDASGEFASAAAGTEPEPDPEPSEKLEVKALPLALLSHQLAYVLALLADAYIHARRTRMPFDVPPGWWSIIPFSQLHLTLRQAVMHQRNCVLDCPMAEAYDATRAFFARSGDIILDLQQLNVKAHLAKKVSVGTVRTELICSFRAAAAAGRRLVLLLRDQPHNLHRWLHKGQLPKAVFKRRQAKELRHLLGPDEELSPDFQVVILVRDLSTEQAEELLPHLLPAYGELATLQLEASSVPSARQVQRVKPVGSDQTACLRLALRVLSLPSRKESLAGCFRRTDIDGDGFISREELRIVLETLNPKLRSRDLGLLFDQVDTNRDGKIDFAEFTTWLCGSAAHRAPAPDPVSGVDIAQSLLSASMAAPAPPVSEGDSSPTGRRWLSRWLSGSWMSGNLDAEAAGPQHATLVDDIEVANSFGGPVVNSDDFEFCEAFGDDWETRWRHGPNGCSGEQSTGNGKPASSQRLSSFPPESPADASAKPHAVTKPCIELAGGTAEAQCNGIWTSFEPLARPTEVELELAVRGDPDTPNACVVFTERRFESSLADAVVGVHFMVRQGLQMASRRGLASIGNDGDIEKERWSRVFLKLDWGRKRVVSQVDSRGQGYAKPMASSFCDARCEGFGFVYIFNMDPHASCWLHSLRVKQDHSTLSTYDANPHNRPPECVALPVRESEQ